MSRVRRPSTPGLIISGSIRSSIPKQVGTCVFWWHGDMMAEKNGDAVGTAYDASGNGNNLTEATNRPVVDILMGHKALYFSATNKKLASAAAIVPTNGVHSLMIVFCPDLAASTSAGQFIGQYQSGVAGRMSFAANQNSGGVNAVGAINPYYNGVSSGAGTDGYFSSLYPKRPLISLFVVNPTSGGAEACKLYRNGTLIDSGTLSAVANTTFTFGQSSDAVSGSFYGWILEAAIWSTGLSDAERGAVDSYLNRKYKFSIV